MQTQEGITISFSEVGLNEDSNADGTLENNVNFFTIVPELNDHDGDADRTDQETPTAPVYRYVEANVQVVAGGPVEGYDLNNDGDKLDVLATVKEADILHLLTITQADFQIDAGAIAATKGLTATPSVIREALVGQEADAREVSVELKIELVNALPDDALVRFFVRDEIDIINTDGTSGLNDAQRDFIGEAVKAERGTQYTASVDELLISAGEKTGTTTLNLTIVDNDGPNAARVFRVQAQVGTISKYAFIKIADDETPTTNIALSVDLGEIKAGTGDREVTVTGTLNGDVFEDDTKVTLVVTGGNATRDTEYTAVLRSLTIPAGETSGSTTITVTALAGGDKKVEIGSVTKALKVRVQYR